MERVFHVLKYVSDSLLTNAGRIAFVTIPKLVIRPEWGVPVDGLDTFSPKVLNKVSLYPSINLFLIGLSSIPSQIARFAIWQTNGTFARGTPQSSAI